MTTPDPAMDRGLQNERTAMAWRRTALSLMIATATMTKVTASACGAAAGLWLLVGTVGGLVILVESSHRYSARRADAITQAPGWSVLIASGTVAIMGLLSLARMV
ncbi:DUF202 domain-containing protein [Nocardioides nanhaiensis]|uniref:DUF202 domain-containing protein n=1 Tax=Nocardioides nanhaiensis TaxID=1476871 RepID=A0ABP8VUX0_9ACTN